MAMLAEFYYHGYGAGANRDKAMHYYRLAAKRGITSAQYKMGLALLVDGKYKDIDQGIHYLQKAARARYKDASFLLGRVYLTDEFDKQDLAKADKYLAIAFAKYQKDMPLLTLQLVNKYPDNFARLFPKLDAAYNKKPLVLSNGKLVWPDIDQVEVITISGNQLKNLFDIQLASYRQPQKSLGSRLPNHSCKKTVGCYQLNSLQELGDFLF